MDKPINVPLDFVDEKLLLSKEDFTRLYIDPAVKQAVESYKAGDAALMNEWARLLGYKDADMLIDKVAAVCETNEQRLGEIARRVGRQTAGYKKTNKSKRRK